MLIAGVLVAAVTAQVAHAVTLTTLVNFTGDNGSFPYAGLTADAAGNLYGTTYWGGVNGLGTVFKIESGVTATPGPVTTLATFTGANGSNPYAGLTVDAVGNLYGTTWRGGANDLGTVFKIPGGATTTPRALTTLHSFNVLSGSFPAAGLTADDAGNLYGTTHEGGSNGFGTVFKIPGGATVTPGPLTTLVNFTGRANGGNPSGGLTVDAAGNLYGTTRGGDEAYPGMVFKIPGGATDTPGALTSLVAFTGRANGANPFADLTADAAGNLYGTTQRGGANNVGTVFKIPSGATATTDALTTLHSFDFFNGRLPAAGLTVDAAGNLYGTTYGGGVNGYGTVFKIEGGATATPGPLTTLVYFNGYANGANPSSGLTADAAGNLYGTTQGGGLYASGTVFRIDGAGFVVPEPTSLAMLASTGLLALRRRR